MCKTIRANGGLPDAVHLLAVLVDERGNCIRRSVIDAYAIHMVVATLELSCSSAGGRFDERSIR